MAIGIPAAYNFLRMTTERPPVRTCPRCGVAMVSRKTDSRSAADDTFECVFCGTVVNIPFEEPRPARTTADRER